MVLFTVTAQVLVEGVSLNMSGTYFSFSVFRTVCGCPTPLFEIVNELVFGGLLSMLKEVGC